MHPIHFAIIGVISIAYGLVTPPYGLCLMIACSVGGIKIKAGRPRHADPVHSDAAGAGDRDPVPGRAPVAAAQAHAGPSSSEPGLRMCIDAEHSSRSAPASASKLDGVDLVDAALSDAAFAEIERAFYAGQVLVLRGQSLTPAQFVAFARRFGPPAAARHRPVPPPGGSEHPDPVQRAGRTASRPGCRTRARTSTPTTPTCRCRRARRRCTRSTVPQVGGDTLFANQQAAYDDLPQAMKTRIEPLSAIHHYGNRHDADERSRTAASPLTDEQKAKMPVITHRSRGRIRSPGASRCTRCPAVRSASSACRKTRRVDLLDELAAHSTQPKYRYSLCLRRRRRRHLGQRVAAACRHADRPGDARTLWRITIKEPSASSTRRRSLAPTFAGRGDVARPRARCAGALCAPVGPKAECLWPMLRRFGARRFSAKLLTCRMQRSRRSRQGP